MTPHGMTVDAENQIIGDERRWRSTIWLACMSAFLIITLVAYGYIQYYLVDWNFANAGVGLIAVFFYSTVTHCYHRGTSEQNWLEKTVYWVSLLSAFVAAVIGGYLFFIRIEI